MICVKLLNINIQNIFAPLDNVSLDQIKTFNRNLLGVLYDTKVTLEKVSHFRAPNDPFLREKWAKALPRKCYVVTDKSYVREMHFDRDGK